MSFCNVSMNLLGIPLSAPLPVLSAWVSRTTPAGASLVPFTDIAASTDDRKVVAVGYTGTSWTEVQHTMLSTDGGETWSHSSETVSPQQQYTMIEYGLGKFSKVSSLWNYSNQTRWSSDWSTWNSGSGNGGFFKTVLFDWTRFIGLWDSYRSISNDWISYTSQFDASIPSTVSQIAYSWTKYAAILNTGWSTSACILGSSDWTSWSTKYTGFFGGWSIAYWNWKFVSLVYNIGWTSVTTLTSSDGESWSTTSFPWVINGWFPYVSFWNWVFVAAYKNNGQWWYYSYDWINWIYGWDFGVSGTLLNLTYVWNGTDKRFVWTFSTSWTAWKIMTLDFV